MNTITFGIAGTGKITHRFLRGMQFVDQAKAVAISSRSMAKAEAYCQEYPELKPYGSYQEMLADPSIQAVYIALPNMVHETAIREALLAGKHVLCEKPMLLHEEQVHACFALAKQSGKVLMEAMKPCFLPTTQKAMDWIHEGKIGKLRYIEAGYCANNVEPFLTGWHALREMGGGALYDIGVYPLAFVNAICSHEIVDVQGVSRTLENGIDAMQLIQLRYGDGVLAQIRCAIDMAADNKAIIYGTEGSITISNFWKSDTAILQNEQGSETFYEPHDASEFQYEIRAFCAAIQQGHKEVVGMREADSARNARVIDQIIRKESMYEI